MSTEAVGNVSKDPSPILDLDPEHSIGKDLDNPTCMEIGRLGHEPSLYLKLARFNRGRDVSGASESGYADGYVRRPRGLRGAPRT